MEQAPAPYNHELTRELEAYQARGFDDAGRFIPKAEAKPFTENEQKLVAEAQGYLRNELRLFMAELTNYNHSAVAVEQEANKFEEESQTALADEGLGDAAEEAFGRHRSELVQVGERYHRAETELRHFREINHIREEAAYPKSRIFHFSIVALAALFEISLNSFFYANAQGLLGGFAVATGVTLVNLGGAVALGIGFRYKNLGSPQYKVFGWFCMALFLFSALYCNALFASFRSAAEILRQSGGDSSQLQQAFAMAWAQTKQLFVLNMQFQDLTGFVLFLIGLLLSPFAMYKGYTSSDKYPGHEQKTRAVLAAQSTVSAVTEGLSQDLRNLMNQARGRVQKLLSWPATIVRKIADEKIHLLDSRRLLEGKVKTVQAEFSVVLKAYRNANLSVRTQPAPAYFEHIPDLAPAIFEEVALSTQHDLDVTRERVESLKDEYRGPLQERLNEIHALSARILGERLVRFQKEIDSLVRARVEGTAVPPTPKTVASVFASSSEQK